MHLFCHCKTEYQIQYFSVSPCLVWQEKHLLYRFRINCHVNNSYRILGNSSVVYFYGGTKDFPFNLACDVLLKRDVLTAFPKGLCLSQTSEEIQIIAFCFDGCISALENLHTRKQSSWCIEHLALSRASKEVT